MPVKIYYPDGTGGPFPVVIVSHGLGGSRDGYEFLVNAASLTVTAPTATAAPPENGYPA